MSIDVQKPEIDYPSSDGEPMAESTLHVQTIIWLTEALEDFYADREDVFIATNLLWYYEEGNRDLRVAPDVMVFLGLPRGHRPSYQMWREGNAVPNVVFEITSGSTREKDEDQKYWLYEELGVGEYFLFDPTREYLVPQLRGFRLQGEVYRRLRSVDLRLESQLGFRLQVEGEMLRLTNLKTGEPILTRLEAKERERQRAEQERQRAEQERQRAEQLISEVERLKALLAKHGISNGNSP